MWGKITPLSIGSNVDATKGLASGHTMRVKKGKRPTHLQHLEDFKNETEESDFWKHSHL